MHHPTPFQVLVQAGVLFALAACGGSDGASPVTLTGKVIGNQGIQGATVCLDLNSSKTCDAGEPASAPTAADGTYSMVVDSAKATAEQLAATPLVATIPASATDAGAPVATVPVTLLAPAGKGAQINPLTTLIQTGVASGLSLAASEAAVALQLGIAKGDLYDYQGQPALGLPYADNARQAAQFVLQALNAGVPLSVVGIVEGPLLDLLLDYDVLAPRILDGTLSAVLARTRAEQKDKSVDDDTDQGATDGA